MIAGPHRVEAKRFGMPRDLRDVLRRGFGPRVREQHTHLHFQHLPAEDGLRNARIIDASQSTRSSIPTCDVPGSIAS